MKKYISTEFQYSAWLPVWFELPALFWDWTLRLDGVPFTCRLNPLEQACIDPCRVYYPVSAKFAPYVQAKNEPLLSTYRTLNAHYMKFCQVWLKRRELEIDQAFGGYWWCYPCLLPLVSLTNNLQMSVQCSLHPLCIHWHHTHTPPGLHTEICRGAGGKLRV